LYNTLLSTSENFIPIFLALQISIFEFFKKKLGLQVTRPTFGCTTGTKINKKEKEENGKGSYL
jgi:hypothetical protein